MAFRRSRCGERIKLLIESMGKIAIYLAPMQGYTDHFFRLALHRCFGGVDMMFTPFMRLEDGALRRRDEKELALLAAEPCTVPQILPKDASEALALSRRLVEGGATRIDINMSCPFVPVVKSGRGAGVFASASAVEQVLSVTEQMPEVTFSLKLRLGIDDARGWQEHISAINGARLSHVSMHARTAGQQYAGDAQRDEFARFFEACSHPCVYNGDVHTIGEAEQVASQYEGLHAVMIGRALVARPHLLAEGLPEGERMERLRDFYHSLSEVYEQHLCGTAQWLDKMQSFWRLFLPDADRRLRKKILKTRKPEAFRAYVEELLSSL